VNADVLSTNSVGFEETNCNVIKPNKLLNPNEPKDTEIISKMLEELDEESEEDEDFKLYFSDNEELEDLLLNDNLPEKDTDSIQQKSVQEKIEKSQESQIIKNASIHDFSERYKMQPRSQTTKNKNIYQRNLPKDLQEKGETEEIEDRNDPSDKESDRLKKIKAMTKRKMKTLMRET